MVDVMLSVHCGTMLAHANNLKTFLLGKGYSVFLCDSMAVGSNYRDEISQNAASCQAMVPFMNEPWCKSGECDFEFKIALRHSIVDKRPIIMPLILEEFSVYKKYATINGFLCSTNGIPTKQNEMNETLWIKLLTALETQGICPAKAADKNLIDEGNIAFSQKQYELAIQKYSLAITQKQDPLDMLYSNRAQAYIEIKQFAKGLVDAMEALVLNPDNEKARHRKALCLIEMGVLSDLSLLTTPLPFELQEKLNVLKQKLGSESPGSIRASSEFGTPSSPGTPTSSAFPPGYTPAFPTANAQLPPGYQPSPLSSSHEFVRAASSPSLLARSHSPLSAPSSPSLLPHSPHLVSSPSSPSLLTYSHPPPLTSSPSLPSLHTSHDFATPPYAMGTTYTASYATDTPNYSSATASYATDTSYTPTSSYSATTATFGSFT